MRFEVLPPLFFTGFPDMTLGIILPLLEMIPNSGWYVDILSVDLWAQEEQTSLDQMSLDCRLSR